MNKCSTHKQLSDLLRYFPAVMTALGIVYCIHSFFSVHAFWLCQLFGVSLLPALIILWLMQSLLLCIWNKLAILYSCASTIAINYINIFGVGAHPNVVRIIFLVIGIVILAGLVRRWLKLRKERRYG